MVSRSRIQIAKADIVARFNEKGPHVLKYREIGAILSAERRGWRLAQKTTIDEFIGFLAKSADLQVFEFDFPNRVEKLCVWGSVPTLEMLLHLKANSYFSHYTAARMHGHGADSNEHLHQPRALHRDPSRGCRPSSDR